MKTRNGKTDKAVEAIRQALEEKYFPLHPKSEIEVYRYNSASIRVRIIDPDFAGKGWAIRNEQIWNLVAPLPENIATQISLLVLLTPKEKTRPGVNIEFENSTPCET
jgi:hypothetical protein